MLTLETTNELLKAVGDQTLELDENNCCEIGLTDGDLIINVRFVPEDGRLLIAAVIGEIPDSSPMAALHLLGELMKANFMWDTTSGNTLSLADDTRIVLQSCYTDASEKPFSEFLLNYAESCEYITAWYADLRNEVLQNFTEEQELNEDDIYVPDDDEEPEEDSLENMGADIRNPMLQA